MADIFLFLITAIASTEFHYTIDFSICVHIAQTYGKMC